MDVAFILDKYFKGMKDVSIDMFDCRDSLNEPFGTSGRAIDYGVKNFTAITPSIQDYSYLPLCNLNYLT